MAQSVEHAPVARKAPDSPLGHSLLSLVKIYVHVWVVNGSEEMKKPVIYNFFAQLLLQL